MCLSIREVRRKGEKGKRFRSVFTFELFRGTQEYRRLWNVFGWEEDEWTFQSVPISSRETRVCVNDVLLFGKEKKTLLVIIRYRVIDREKETCDERQF